jgi:hypothetical protein
MQRVTFRLGNTIQVFRLGNTTNAKIAQPKTDIVQSYTFSLAQFEYLGRTERSMSEFYTLDHSNCGDCPFSGNINGKMGFCYTHKINQYKGFVSMLKSIKREFGSVEYIPEFNEDIQSTIVEFSANKYVRFGTYGEPSLHPQTLIEKIVAVCSTWTGYTHQYMRYPELSKYFMASTHDQHQADMAREKFGYRSFVSSENGNVDAVQCPASKETGFKSTCQSCGLCSGTTGKGRKDVKILLH